MGLARGAIALLLEEAKIKPFSGRIATLGKQTIYASNQEIRKQFAKFGVYPAEPIDISGPVIDDVRLFRALGFETVHSFDYSDFEGADFVVDLNQHGMPSESIGAYDVVLDSGTLEHIFHLPNALANVVDLVKVGGRIVLLSPSSNHIDHGFYMFSPTLFSDFLGANRFMLDKIYVVRYSGDLNELWEAYEYEPGAWRDLHIGGLDGNPYAIFVVATRTERSTSNVVPQQGYYANSSESYVGSRLARVEHDGAAGGSTKSTIATASQSIVGVEGSPMKTYLRTLIKRIPGARRAALWLLARVRWLMPTVSAKPGQSLNKTLVGRY